MQDIWEWNQSSGGSCRTCGYSNFRRKRKSNKQKLAALYHANDSIFAMTSGLRSVRDKSLTYVSGVPEIIRRRKSVLDWRPQGTQATTKKPVGNCGKKYNKRTQELRRAAVRMVKSEGSTTAAIWCLLGVNVKLLRKWRQRYGTLRWLLSASATDEAGWLICGRGKNWK